MNNIIVFDTSVGSMNIGDQIINRSFDKEMKGILDGSFVVKYSTHTPVSHFYQNIQFNRFYRYVKSCKYKFISGTNILNSNILEPWPNWNVNIFNYLPYKNSILVGCGFASSKNKINLYTRTLYKRILSKNFVHSVRDDKTKEMLEKLGLKAINTGCVTMWGLTSKHCLKIPQEKSDRVVFTLTDYKQDRKYDQELIKILKKNYKEIYFWVQGSNDLEYFQSLDKNNIKIINPNLDDFINKLKEGNVDYIGTRLHAGICAMQNYVRSIILIVDNRARDIKESYNLPAIERTDIEHLEKIINSSFRTDIHIHENEIKRWKKQFNK